MVLVPNAYINILRKPRVSFLLADRRKTLLPDMNTGQLAVLEAVCVWPERSGWDRGRGYCVLV